MSRDHHVGILLYIKSFSNLTKIIAIMIMKQINSTLVGPVENIT